MYYLGMCSALLWQLAEEGRRTGFELESLQWKFGNKFATQKNVNQQTLLSNDKNFNNKQ